jgi:hypothetical protein
MRRGRASSLRGIISFSTPSCRFASIFEVPKWALNGNVRAKRDPVPQHLQAKALRRWDYRFCLNVKVAVADLDLEFVIRHNGQWAPSVTH